MGASDEAAALARRAEALARLAAEQKRRASRSKAIIGPGTAALSALFEAPALRRPLARRAAGVVLDNRAAEELRQLEGQYARWHADAEAFLGRVSVAFANLTRSGNSRRLQTQLATTKSTQSLEPRCRRGAQLLEKFANRPLVYNGEIPKLLQERARLRQEERRQAVEHRVFAETGPSPDFDVSVANRPALEMALASYPEARTALLGALDALAGNGRDRARQAMASCRLALEGLAQKLTGTPLWKNALKERHGKSRAGSIGALYELLSSAVHGGHAPSQADAEMATRQTAAVCVWMVASHEPLEMIQR